MHALYIGKWLVWGEVIDVLRLQKELYESAESLFSRAWESQKYAVLLLYCTIPPARGREYRELKICVTDGDLQLWEPLVRDSNWLLIASDHSRGLLYVGSHKTSKFTGVQRIELSRDGSTHLLLDHLVAFICRERPVLLQGNAHDWVFVVSLLFYSHAHLQAARPLLMFNYAQNHAGLPFESADGWTKAIQAIFMQHKGVAISTNTIRASYVTDLLSGESGSELPEHVLSQVARAMRHSRAEQLRTYDRRTSSDKVARAVEHTATRVANALDIPGPSSSTPTHKKKVHPPSVGDVVGLVEDRSTHEHPVIMLGKVMRVFPDVNEVLLAHLNPLPKSKKTAPTYKLTVGKDAWVESIHSLVFPVDVVYDQKSATYTLRTPVRDIHDYVHNDDSSSDDD